MQPSKANKTMERLLEDLQTRQNSAEPHHAHKNHGLSSSSGSRDLSRVEEPEAGHSLRSKMTSEEKESKYLDRYFLYLQLASEFLKRSKAGPVFPGRFGLRFPIFW